MSRTYYTIYDETDDILASGTRKECASILGIKPESFSSSISKIKSGEQRRKWIVVIEKVNNSEETVSCETYYSPVKRGKEE